MQYKAENDQEKLALLYERYMEMVYAVCLKYLEDRENAKDAVMDIYETLGGKIIKHEISNFRSWLYTVVKHHCLMQLRKTAGKRIVAINDGLMQSEAESHLDNVNTREMQLGMLNDCIELLSAEQKSVIELFYLQQKCYHEIVELTGFEWNKVRSHVQNGRRNLKLCMESKNRHEQA